MGSIKVSAPSYGCGAGIRKGLRSCVGIEGADLGVGGAKPRCAGAGRLGDRRAVQRGCLKAAFAEGEPPVHSFATTPESMSFLRIPRLYPSTRLFPLFLAASSAAACSSSSSSPSVEPLVDGGPMATADAHGDGAMTMPPSGDASMSADADGGPDSSQDTSAVEQQVAMLLSQMTLAEKVGQMVMIDYTGLDSAADVTTYGIGAVLAGGDEAPGSNTPQDWLGLTNQMRASAALTRLHIPALFGIDAVHGNAKVQGATVFPHGIAMGSTRDAALVTQEEQITASELVAMGITMSFSPDSDVGQDERWGRTYESFGEDPTLVSQMVAAAVSGYQQPFLGAPGTVLACVKHAVGAGGTTWGTGVDGGIDQGDTQITEAEMRAVHLPPFQAAVNAGAMAMMVSYSSWNGTKMSASAEWLTSILKGELGYKGFLLSDFNAVAQLPGDAPTQEATAINAGLDMIMMSKDAPGFISDVETLVGAGTIPQSRIDDAVTRILRAKVIAGLFSASPPDGSALASTGSAAHRQVARQAVHESMVLLQNNGNVLPLSKSAHVFVAGPGANDVGVQSGGWTLGWQGVTETMSAGIGGTTLLAGLQNTASSPGLVTYTYDGSSVPAGTDVGVVVLYENPYAEYLGDTDDPDFTNVGTSQNPSGHIIYDGLASGIVSNMEAANIPLVLVLVTGRPVHIESYLSKFSAVVAAWLPGSEGEGVADVLYGDAHFTGKLPKSWPKDSTTLPISSLQTGADPLFAFGFGL
jgi:beta-glucosidase